MSSKYYKVQYHTNSGVDMSRVDGILYVHEHNTSGVTTVYNEYGRIQFQFGGDCEGNYASQLAKIIQGDEFADEELVQWEDGDRDKFEEWSRRPIL